MPIDPPTQVSIRIADPAPTRRPRVTCPHCRRDVALTPKGAIVAHRNSSEVPNTGYWCDATGTQSEGAVRAADLRRLAELVATYPDWARQLVAQLPE